MAVDEGTVETITITHGDNTLKIEDIEKYYTIVNEPDAAAALLAEALGLPEHRFDARSAIQVDYASSLLELAKDLSFGPVRTLSLFTTGQALLRACTEDQAPLSEATALLQQLLLNLVRPQPGNDGPFFGPEHVHKIGRWFTATILRHYQLYSFVFHMEQAHTEYTRHELVETPLIQTFEPAMSEEEWEQYHAGIRAAADEAAAAAAAAELARVEAEERELAARLKAEEEERRAAELARKPATLEEAIETMVAVRLEQEKVLLEQQYKTKQEALMAKIAELETRVVPEVKMPGEKMKRQE